MLQREGASRSAFRNSADYPSSQGGHRACDHPRENAIMGHENGCAGAPVLSLLRHCFRTVRHSEVEHYPVSTPV
jgi:hypothetical protein